MKKLLLIPLLLAASFANAANIVSLGVSVANNTPTITWSATWASSCTASGAWSGSKATTGTQTLPVVTSSVTYTLTCSSPTDTTATLTWVAPTTNTDGTALTNLSGFNIYSGTSATALSFLAQAKGATTLTYQALNQAAGTQYYAVTAYNTQGLESPKSTVVSKTFAAAGGSATSSITLSVPAAPANVGVN